MTQEYEKGGLKMIDLDNFILSLKCTWLKRVLTGGQSWIHIFKANFGNNIEQVLYDFGDDYFTQLINISSNKFWKDTFLAWQNILRNQLLNTEFYTDEEFLLLPVWYNSLLKIKFLCIKNIGSRKG